jgi:hypothetical protein
MYVLNCQVIPFPLARRTIVQKLARELYAYRPETADRRLAQHLNLERQSLLHKGILPGTVEHQIRVLERAIRDELWQLTLFGGDAA